MKIRFAEDSDADAIARVHVASWRGAYAGLLPASFLNQLSVERRAAGWRRILADPGVDVFVAVNEAGDVVGFASLQSSRDDDAQASTGELTTIYVAPDAWGEGYGRSLMEAVVEQARRREFGAVTLWVLEGNQRARRFYAVAGFSLDGATKTETIGDDVELREVRYRMTLSGSGWTTEPR